MPDSANSGAGEMAQGSTNNMLRKSQNNSNAGGSASGNNVQGHAHNSAIAESYEVKILQNPSSLEPQQHPLSSSVSMHQPQSNAPMNDLDM